ncbi:MAG: VTT domain-containing protein [Chloroflexota bacterium]|nr:VTT domain-containing protein [Chloroflexota bacterium]
MRTSAPLTLLGSTHGTLAVVILCLLLLVEETGIPIPGMPGELMLIAAGLLVANGDVSPWIFVPTASVAVFTGALIGYSWTRLLGATGVRALAARLHVSHHLDRASARLTSAGPLTIAVSRLIPGMRITTTLLAGALGVKRRAFLAGIAPAIVLWIATFTALGAVVGVPVERVLGRIDYLALQSAVLLAIGVGAFLAVRHVPAIRGRDDDLPSAPSWERITLAAGIDLGAIASIVVGLDAIALMALRLPEPDGWNDILVVIAVTTLTYLAVSRKGIGRTVGEAAVSVTYRSGTRNRSA